MRNGGKGEEVIKKGRGEKRMMENGGKEVKNHEKKSKK